ncbi:hypothetical protein ABZY68_07120 [Streptomyces sp. NPDC006482]|uniref:hypothetical protein n=1 Tax=Streptomyces sp. NPDC006482 TaxID=3154306 RepID=UPI0033B89C20
MMSKYVDQVEPAFMSRMKTELPPLLVTTKSELLSWPMVPVLIGVTEPSAYVCHSRTVLPRSSFRDVR